MPNSTVTVQRSDEEPRQMAYVRAEGDRHVVSEFRHGRQRFYSVLRSEIKDDTLPVMLTDKEEEDQVFIADFFLYSEPEVPGY